MVDCALIEKCIFFNDKMASMPSASNMMKRKYCKEDSAKCARFMVFSAMGREKVPTDLYPNDLPRAQTILGKTA